ncbi:MAG TPA: DEAD/DEAH box helicase, partial [Candidatus Binataceae bacterium]|nr:DEAD/DEAH box helicase [Candidatus Binataceae bacterium]
MTSVLDAFHPAVRAWFAERFGSPAPAQTLGWPVIAECDTPPGHDVLLCAPTGSGKTLAAFMWAIDRLFRDAERGELGDRVSVLYVSPLKALANDIKVNLEEPLIGIRQTAQRLAVGEGRSEEVKPILEVRAGLRTGDTPANERSAMLRRPPHILVTTPESLFILLTSPRFRQSLSAVRYVIVDELHALAPNKRGAHLMLTLERLERMVRLTGAPRPARIGLSATLNPIERLAGFLAGVETGADGARRPRPVKVVRADDRARRMDLQVIAPGPDLGALATHQHWEAMYDAVAALVREHRTTLVFTLSRRWAERIALNLQKRLGNDAVMAHHGSLARAERLAAEQRLKRGELRALVATASLELGIDVGAVELVCQIDSPKTISAAIQRIGRSGHRLDATPKGRLFALTLDDLLECAAAVRAIRHGRLDEVEIPTGCLDVAAQQIVAIAAEEDEIGEADLLRTLRGAYNFAELDHEALRHLLDQMAAELPARIQGAAPKIFYDRIGARVRARRGARLAAITSGGTIPESGNLDVVIESQGRKIGDIEEDFAQESSRGDIFALGSMPWRVLGISRNRFLVEPAPGMAPSLPFWQTEAAGRSPALSAEVSELRGEIFERITRGDEAAAAAFLSGECAMDERAARQAIDYVRRGQSALGAIPNERTIVVERFFDGLGGTQVVIHTPFGMRVNRGLGLAIRKRLCQSFDFEIQASAIDDAVLLALNARHSFPLESLMAMISSRTVRHVLGQALLAAPMFEVRMRHVATRALAVMRSSRGRKVPAWIQRLRAQELAAAIFPGREACLENRPPDVELPAHFIATETMHECLTESTDIGRIEELLRAIEQGATRVVTVDAIAPSVFTHRILLAWDYSFLDDGERANRRSRTVSLNRAMAEDVLRTEDLSAMLAAEAVEGVEAEVSGRAMARRARDRDELYQLIRAHGALAAGALEERVAGEANAMLSSLEREGRVVRARFSSGAPERLIASEDAALFAAAYPEAIFERHAEAPPPVEVSGARALEADDAEREIVRRAMATSGPVEIAELAERLKMAPATLEKHLLALEAKGLIFRGHFTPRRAALGASRGRAVTAGAVTASPEQWCDRYNLEKIHRLTLSRLRAETEPCADHEYAAFRMRWNHVGGAGIAADQSGVAAVLEQLSGVALSPELWERAILPARIPGYRPEWLDLLCLGGEVVWAAVPGEDAGDEVPARITFLRRRRAGAARFDEAAANSAAAELTDRDEQRVFLALAAGGAQYLDQLAERAGLAERTALAALWRLAAAGRVSNDSFAPLRLLWAAPEAVRAMAPGAHRRARHDAALRARLRSSVTGRWSALGTGAAALAAAPVLSAKSGGGDTVGAARGASAAAPAALAPTRAAEARSEARAPARASERDVSRDLARDFARDLARERAESLLNRNGIVTREMLGLESPPMAWHEVSFALRRMEYAGSIRRGYFVRALSGEQYALPAALEMLAASRNLNPAREHPVALSAADPANPYGAMLPGCGVAREAGNFVVLRGGRVMLGLAGRALLSLDALDDEAFSAAVGALVELRRKVLVETIDGAPALASIRVDALAAMGFHSDGRALV